MLPLGESTLAFDEEMLRLLDAVEPTKPPAKNVCPAAVNKDALEKTAPSTARASPGSLAALADKKRVVERVPQPTGQEPQKVFGGIDGDCKRQGWKADCKDIAQRLLFSEDSEEGEHAQRNPEKIQSTPTSTCINGLSGQDSESGLQADSFTT